MTGAIVQCSDNKSFTDRVRICCLHNESGTEYTLLFWCGCKYLRVYSFTEWHQCKVHLQLEPEANFLYPPR